jgi:linearmycin/streptolysin S transport system ATP-binding protein
MDDVAAELPLLLETVRRAGRSVEDVDVRSPSLQAVFIHLTGRELRE